MSSSRRPSSTQSAKKRAVSSPSRAVAKKVPARNAPAPSATAKKAVAKKAAAKSVVTKNVETKSTPAQKAPAKKVAANKVPNKKAPAKKVAASKKPSTKTPSKSASNVSSKAVTKATVKKATASTSLGSTRKNSSISNSKVSKKAATTSVAKKAISSHTPRVSEKVAKNSHPEEKKVLLKKSQDAISKSNDPVKKDEVTPTTPKRPAGVAHAVFRETPPKPAVKRPAALPVQDPPRESAPNLVATDDPGFLDSSEVFDETDHAQHQQLREQAAIQERARQMARPETHPDFDGLHCVDCDDEIPEFRLKIGRVRCVDCQQAIEDERRRKQGMTSPTGPRLPEDWQM